MQIQKSFTKTNVVGSLFLVPTPIGNLSDISLRALDTLKMVDFIASEDTRNTKKLLNHFEIQKEQISLHEHNVNTRVPQLIEKLLAGKNIAQVSDAGMPVISDPGQELVFACIEHDIPIISLPGATAGVTALIASGILAQPFTFYGFLPRKTKEQVAFFEKQLLKPEAQIFYESPFRIKDTVKNIAGLFPEKQVVVARELTKIHEEYLRGTASELFSYLEENAIKGECVLIVEGNKEEVAEDHEDMSLPLKEHVEKIMTEEELSSKEAIKKVAKLRNLKKQEVYNAYHEINA